MKEFWAIFILLFISASAHHDVHLLHADRFCANVSSDHNILLPSPADCRIFYKCENGMALPQSCPPGLHWCEALTECILPALANCTIGHVPVTYPPGEEPPVTPGPNPSGPSCPVEGQVYADPDNCGGFYICIGGKPVQRQCSGNSAFSALIGTCVEAQVSICIDIIKPGLTCPKNGETFSNILDCSSFYECVNGTIESQECHDGQHFNSFYGECTSSDLAHCKTYTTQRPTSVSTIKTPVAGQDLCPGNGFTMPNYEDCHSYWLCTGDTFVKKPCPEGFYYSCWDQTCLPASSAQCEPTPGENCTKSGEKLANPQDCSSYYECIDHVVQQEHCPSGNEFNAWFKECVASDLSHCKVRTTTPNVPTPTPSVPTPTPNPNTDVCPYEGAKLPDLTDCHSYYICVNNVPQKQSCPLNTIYSCWDQACLPPDSGVCITSPNQNGQHCSKNSSSLPDAEDCGSYYECVNGIVVEKQCPIGLEYNKWYDKCVTPNLSHCQHTTTTSEPTTPEPATPKPCVVDPTITANPMCSGPNSDTYIYPQYTHCNQYMKCDCNKRLETFTCQPPEYHYNCESKKCENITHCCSPRPETTPGISTLSSNLPVTITTPGSNPPVTGGEPSTTTPGSNPPVTGGEPSTTTPGSNPPVTGGEPSTTTPGSNPPVTGGEPSTTTPGSNPPVTGGEPSTTTPGSNPPVTGSEPSTTTPGSNPPVTGGEPSTTTPGSNPPVTGGEPSTTTPGSNPPVTGGEPSTTTPGSNPPVTGGEPSTTTPGSNPPVTGGEPSTTTPGSNPPVTGGEPSTTTPGSNPPVTGGEPSTTTSGPNPPVTGGEPSTTTPGSNPPVTGGEPSTTTPGSNPPVTGGEPSTTTPGSNPPVTGGEPSTTTPGSNPPVTGGEPSTTTPGSNPPVTGGEPSTTTPGSNPPVTGGEPSTTTPGSNPPVTGGEPSTTTPGSNPPVTGGEPSTTTPGSNPPVTGGEPSTTTPGSNPPVTGGEPSTTTPGSNPPVTGGEPSTTTPGSNPPVTGGEPSTTTSGPNPPVTGGEPSTTTPGSNPPVTGGEPSTTTPGSNPPVTGGEPSTTTPGSNPPVTGGEPSTTTPGSNPPVTGGEPSTTTPGSNPPVTGGEPSTTTPGSNPPVTGGEPSTTTSGPNPPVTGGEPSTTTPGSNPPVTGGEPSTTTPGSNPPVTGGEPSTTTSGPNPPVTGGEPSTTTPGSNPPVTGGEPSTTTPGSNPPVTGGEPSTTTPGSNPPVTGGEPSTTTPGSNPPVTGGEPSTTTPGSNPPVTGGEPSTTTPGSNPPVTGGEPSTTTSGPNPPVTGGEPSTTTPGSNPPVTGGEPSSTTPGSSPPVTNSPSTPKPCVPDSSKQPNPMCLGANSTNYKYPAYKDCNAFMICDCNHQLQQITCDPPEYNYNCETKTCENIEHCCAPGGHITKTTPTTITTPSSPSSTSTLSPSLSKCPLDLEGVKLPNPQDCKTYFTCLNGEIVVTPCPAGEIYSCWDQKCENPQDSTCINNPAQVGQNCSNSNELVQNVQNCTGYYQCVNGKVESKFCASGQMFSPLLRACVQLDAQMCHTYPTVTVRPPTGTTLPPDPVEDYYTCPFDGAMFPNLVDCNSYYICINGLPELQNCPAGEIYSCWDQKCLPKNNGTCASVGEQQGNKCTINGVRVSSTDCTSYYECVNGIIVLTKCPDGQEFNAAYLECYKPKLSHCQTVTSLPPTTVTMPSTTLKPNPGNDVCPEEGALLPNPRNCSTYYKCINQVPTLQLCADGYEYSCWDQRCEPAGTAQCIATGNPANNTCKYNGQRVANPQDCHSYYQCVNGVTELRHCPFNLFFNKWFHICFIEILAHCDKAPVQTTMPTPATPPIGTTENCPVNGLLMPYPQDCTKYYKCENHQPVLHSCPSGQEYSCWDQQCTAPNNAQCINSGQQVGHNCSKNGERLPDIENCGSYYECNNGVVVRQYCFIGFSYNRWYQKCVLFPFAHCKPVTIAKTTTQSTTTPLSTPSVDYDMCPYEGAMFPDLSDCSKYYICVNHTLDIRSCPTGQSYSCWDQKCLPEGEGHCINSGVSQVGANCSVENLSLVDNQNCSSYYECVNATVVLKHCGPGLEFNSNFQGCYPPKQAHCQLAPTQPPPTSSPKLPSTPDPVNDVCPEEGAMLPNPQNCSTFFKCIKGVPVLQQCADGLEYSCWDQECQPSSKAQCISEPISNNQTCKNNGERMQDPTTCHGYLECVKGTVVHKKCFLNWFFNKWFKFCVPVEVLAHCPRPVTVKPQTTVTTKKPSTVDNCPDEGALIASPTDCTKYYQCVNGHPTLKTCPSGQIYSYLDEECRNPSEGRCINVGSPVGLSCKREGLRVQNLQSCTSYYVCLNGKVDTGYCLPTFKYSRWYHVCALDLFSHCQTYPTVPPPTTAAPLLTTKQYPFSFCSGTNEVPCVFDCNKYYVCQKNHPVQHNCLPGKNYDAFSKTCVPEGSAKCGGILATYVGQSCPKDGVNEPNAKDCGSYFTCKERKITKVNCPIFQQYDVWEHRCKLSILATCISEIQNLL